MKIFLPFALFASKGRSRFLILLNLCDEIGISNSVFCGYCLALLAHMSIYPSNSSMDAIDSLTLWEYFFDFHSPFSNGDALWKFGISLEGWTLSINVCMWFSSNTLLFIFSSSSNVVLHLSASYGR